MAMSSEEPELRCLMGLISVNRISKHQKYCQNELNRVESSSSRNNDNQHHQKQLGSNRINYYHHNSNKLIIKRARGKHDPTINKRKRGHQGLSNLGLTRNRNLMTMTSVKAFISRSMPLYVWLSLLSSALVTSNSLSTINNLKQRQHQIQHLAPTSNNPPSSSSSSSAYHPNSLFPLSSASSPAAAAYRSQSKLEQQQHQPPYYIIDHSNQEQKSHQNRLENHHQKIIKKRSIFSGKQQQAANLYDRFIANCCNNSNILANRELGQQLELVDPKLFNNNAEHDGGEGDTKIKSFVTKRDQNQQMLSRPQQQMTSNLLRSPTCHHLALLWNHLKSAYPSLAANLLSAVSQRERISAGLMALNPKTNSELLLNHKNVANLLDQADRLIGQLESYGGSRIRQRTQQQRHHQLERLLSNPSYAKLIRHVQLREGAQSISSSSSSSLNNDNANNPNQQSQSQLLIQTTTTTTTTEKNPLANELMNHQSQLQQQQQQQQQQQLEILHDLPRESQQEENGRDFEITPEAQLADELALGSGVQSPIVTRKPPKHVSIGRIIYHPNEASSAGKLAPGDGSNSNHMWPSSHRATIEKLHHLHKYNNKNLPEQQQPASFWSEKDDQLEKRHYDKTMLNQEGLEEASQTMDNLNLNLNSNTNDDQLSNINPDETRKYRFNNNDKDFGEPSITGPETLEALIPLRDIIGVYKESTQDKSNEHRDPNTLDDGFNQHGYKPPIQWLTGNKARVKDIDNGGIDWTVDVDRDSLKQIKEKAIANGIVDDGSNFTRPIQLMAYGQNIV